MINNGVFNTNEMQTDINQDQQNQQNVEILPDSSERINTETRMKRNSLQDCQNLIEENKKDDNNQNKELNINNDNKSASLQITVQDPFTEQPIYINSRHGYKGIIFPLKIAIISMVINIFLPGIGTMIGTNGMNEDILINEYMCKGCCQFVTTICIVGWFYAQYTSYYYIKAALFKRPFETYRTKTIIERQMKKSISKKK